jgi:MFS family permease
MAAGISVLVLGGSKSIHWLGTGVFLIGFVAAIIMVATHTLTQEVTPGGLRGRVFSGLEIIINSSFLFFVWIAGTLGSRYPLSLIFYAIGVCLVLYAALLFLLRIAGRGARDASLHLI